MYIYALYKYEICTFYKLNDISYLIRIMYVSNYAIIMIATYICKKCDC